MSLSFGISTTSSQIVMWKLKLIGVWQHFSTSMKSYLLNIITILVVTKMQVPMA